jgi:hypothetical protein
LRFCYPGPGTLPQWIREQLLEDLVPAFAASLLQKLDDASKMTAAEEARALTHAAGQECLPRMNPDAAERWPAMFLARHISAQGTGKTLVEVGDANGLTRERVRQICEAFEEVFHRSEAVTPALAERWPPSHASRRTAWMRRTSSWPASSGKAPASSA